MSNKTLIFIFLSSIVCFIIFSFLVYAGFFLKIDPRLTVLSQKTISSSWSEPLSALTLVGSVEVTGTILMVLLLLKYKRNLFLIAVILFLFASPVLIEIIGKNLLYHPGPPKQFFRFNFPIFFPSHYTHTNYAFPSGHMLRTTFLVVIGSVSVINSRFRRSYKILAITALLAVLFSMAVSRVFLGEHWTSDVLGGIALGTAFGALAGLFLNRCEDSKIEE